MGSKEYKVGLKIHPTRSSALAGTLLYLAPPLFWLTCVPAQRLQYFSLLAIRLQVFLLHNVKATTYK